VLFCFQLVEDEVLQCCGFEGSGELSVSYFLVVGQLQSWFWIWEGEEGLTLMLPSISLLTGVNATDPSTSAGNQRDVYKDRRECTVPNRVVNDSAASRNSVVEMALSFSLSIGTSVKDFLSVSRKVPPGGYALVVAMASEGCNCGREER